MPVTLGSNSISGLSAGGIDAGVVNNATLTAGAVNNNAVKGGISGYVVQSVMGYYNSTWSSGPGGGSWFNFPLSASITPLYSSSRILVMFSCGSNFQQNSGRIRILSNGNVITNMTGENNNAPNGIGDEMYHHAIPGPGDGNHAEGRQWTFIDSPGTTSTVTYQVQGYTEASGTGNVFFNASPTGYNTSGNGTAYAAHHISNLIMMEVL